MKFDISNIPFSIRDRKEGIQLPEILTRDVAEFIGIMIGDGHVGLYRDHKNKRNYYVLQISGHSDDKKYQMDYINELIFKIFNTTFRPELRENVKIIVLRKQSQAICLFLKQIGIPNVKTFVEVPQCILQSSLEMKAAFLRGLADSDFCVSIKSRNYILIKGVSCSEKLIVQCSQIMNELGIKNHYGKEYDYSRLTGKTHVTYRIYVNGHSRVKLFMERVGFQNVNKVRKYESFIHAKSTSSSPPDNDPIRVYL